MSQALNIQS